jgi:hypothetical protein
MNTCRIQSIFVRTFCRMKIDALPDGDTWKSMTHLQVLYLHDNLLSSYDDIKALAQVSCLEIVTLYDTPLSLKKNYRHHVVNSLWSLKVNEHLSTFDT